MALDGILKQQFTEADGRLSWERRQVRVDPVSASLAISDIKDENPVPTTTISLRGVKYAKEWSFSSAVSGYGFDLVWFSGQLWSFMSCEENECRQWVTAINEAIASGIRKSAERTSETHARPPLPPQTPRNEPLSAYNQSASGSRTRTSEQQNPAQGPTWMESAKRYQRSYDQSDDDVPFRGPGGGITAADPNRRSGEINLVSSFQSEHGRLAGDTKGTGFIGVGSEQLGGDHMFQHSSWMAQPQPTAAPQSQYQASDSDSHSDAHSAAQSQARSHHTETVSSSHSTRQESHHNDQHSDHHQAHASAHRHHLNQHHHRHHHHHDRHKDDRSSHDSHVSNVNNHSSNGSSDRSRREDKESGQHNVGQSAEQNDQSRAIHRSYSHSHSQDDEHHPVQHPHQEHHRSDHVHHADYHGSGVPTRHHGDASIEHDVNRPDGPGQPHGGHHQQQENEITHEAAHAIRHTNSTDETVSVENPSHGYHTFTNREDMSSSASSHRDQLSQLRRSHDTLDDSVLGSVRRSNVGVGPSAEPGGGSAPERLQFSRLPPEGIKLPAAGSAPLSHAPYGTAHRWNDAHLSREPLPVPVHHPATTGSAQMAERVESERARTLQSMSMDRPTAQVFAQEIATWQSKCQILEMQLEWKSNELEAAKQRQTQLQDKLDQVTAECEQRLDMARDRERQLLADTKRELENKMLRMSNENISFFEAANKSAKLQHERELACLREELAEERKRHTGLLDRSQALRDRAEKAEAEAQHELATLRDKYSTLHVEETRLRRELEIERAAFEKERVRLAKEHEAALTAAQEEKERAQVTAHRELRDKIAELNEKMQASLQQIRQSDSEALRHELEGRRIRDLAELHKKCQADIEAVRTEERRLAAIEIENIRNAFLSREHQTAEDLVQLERLHGTRVSQLEQQLQALRAENGLLQERVRAAQQEAQHGSQQAQRGEAEMRSRMEGYAQRAEVLHRELLDAHKEIQEGKAREASYREQLSQAITQSRLQHAELLEAKQQVSSGSAAVFQWRNATRESDLSISAAETALRISRDEVAMLEHQLRRVEEENALLKLELQRSDRLVYGANMANARNGGAMADAAPGLNATSLSTAYLLRGTVQTPVAKVSPPRGHGHSHAGAALSQSMLSGTARSVKTRKAATPKR